MDKPIPQLNLDDFRSDSAAERDAFVQALGDAFSEVGFVAIRGNLLNWRIIDRLYEQIQLFFRLPQSLKDPTPCPTVPGNEVIRPLVKKVPKGEM